MEAKVDLIVPLLWDVEPWKDSVMAALALNELPIHLWIYNDGAGQEGDDAIRDVVMGQRSRFLRATAMKSGGRIYMSKAVNRLIAESLRLSTAEYVAVVHPSVIVESRYWTDTLLQPFSKDRNCAYVASTMAGEFASSPWKVKRFPVNKDRHTLQLCMFRKLVLKKNGSLPDSGPDDLHGSTYSWETMVNDKHWNCWREARISAIERERKEPIINEQAYAEIVRRTRGEALVFVDV